MREFNITGLCVPDKHYMVNIGGKVAAISEMVDKGLYFTINRGRQKGKTTILTALERSLETDYLAIGISFEGVSDIFEDVEKFCGSFFGLIADSFKCVNPGLSDAIETYGIGMDNYKPLSKSITRFCADMKRKTGKSVVLMIDEVDRASNFYVFMDFLGMLRTKYLDQNKGKDISFKSVILAGVNDIKRLKAHIKDRRAMTESESETLRRSEYNSPWNIAADFELDVDFSPSEIETLLDDYLSEHSDVKMDKMLVSETIFKHSSGYPFLVSKLCKIIVEKLSGNWTVDGVHAAINILMDEKNTLFDDLIKNVSNVPSLNHVTTQLLLCDEELAYNVDAYEVGIMYSIFRNEHGKVAIHNKIFATRLYNYFIALREMKCTRLSDYSGIPYMRDDGSLEIETALLKFQEYFKSVYASIDAEFIEREGRLILMAFFKPIINGKGFYFVESHTGYEKRQDLVMTVNNFKYIVELKVWRGEEYHRKGIAQLAEYLELESQSNGYLVCFNFNAGKEYKSAGVSHAGKEIFIVWV